MNIGAGILKSEEARGLLEFFMKNARQIESPHDSEWKAFYEFVNYCHDHRVGLTEEGLLSILKANGFKNGDEITAAYRHIREFMGGTKSRSYKRRARVKGA